MHHSLTINNNTPFSFEAFHKVLGIKLQLNFTADFNQATYYYFTQKDSVTLFCLVDNRQGTLELCMDALASYSDYRLFPYLADTLHHFLRKTVNPEVYMNIIMKTGWKKASEKK